MRRGTVLLALCSPLLAANPLAPLNHSLLAGDQAAAWPALAHSWPQLSSRAQRDAWLRALATLTAEHCGKDAPLALPAWLPALTLELAQRDMPLARNWRVTLSGQGWPQRWQLLDGSGHDWLAGAQAEREGDGFRLSGPDRAQPLAAGVYRLSLWRAGVRWQASLALPGAAGLAWLSRSPLAVAQLPPARAACPAPWLEQTLLRRDDYRLLWWQRREPGEPLHWPDQAGDAWQSVALVRAENRGALVLRVVHRQVGRR